MIRRRRPRGVLLVASLLVPAIALAGDEAPRVAVLATSSGVPEPVAAAVAAATVETARQAGASAVPPGDVEREMLSVKSDVAACAKEPSCVAMACVALGADALLASSVRDVGGGWLIEIRLREGRGGSLRGGAVASVPRDERAAREAAARLARQMMDKLMSGRTPASAAARPGSPTRAGAAAAVPAGAQPHEPSPRPRPPDAEARAEPQAGATSAADPKAATPEPRLAPDVRLAADARGAKTGPSSRRRWGLILASGGVALLAGGVAAGAIAWSESDGSYALLATGSLEGFALKRASSRTFAWTAAGLGGAGAAALAAGVWLRLGGRSSPVSLSLDPGCAGARVALAF